jgi:hypothetical protein
MKKPPSLTLTVKWLAILFLMIGVMAARATDVFINLPELGANPSTNRLVTWQQQTPFIGNLFYTNTGPTNGFWQSNVPPNILFNYTVKGPPAPIPFQIFVPSSGLGGLDMSNFTSVGTASTYPAGGVAPSWQAAFSIFALNGQLQTNSFYPLNSNPSNYTQLGNVTNVVGAIGNTNQYAPGANVTMSTNGAVITITSTGGGSATNAISIQNGSGNATVLTNATLYGTPSATNFDAKYFPFANTNTLIPTNALPALTNNVVLFSSNQIYLATNSAFAVLNANLVATNSSLSNQIYLSTNFQWIPYTVGPPFSYTNQLVFYAPAGFGLTYTFDGVQNFTNGNYTITNTGSGYLVFLAGSLPNGYTNSTQTGIYTYNVTASPNKPGLLIYQWQTNQPMNANTIGWALMSTNTYTSTNAFQAGTNAIYAAINASGISAATATNISSNQVYLGTNGLGFGAFASSLPALTNNPILFGSNIAATMTNGAWLNASNYTQAATNTVTTNVLALLGAGTNSAIAQARSDIASTNKSTLAALATFQLTTNDQAWSNLYVGPMQVLSQNITNTIGTTSGFEPASDGTFIWSVNNTWTNSSYPAWAMVYSAPNLAKQSNGVTYDIISMATVLAATNPVQMTVVSTPGQAPAPFVYFGTILNGNGLQITGQPSIPYIQGIISTNVPALARVSIVASNFIGPVGITNFYDGFGNNIVSNIVTGDWNTITTNLAITRYSQSGATNQMTNGNISISGALSASSILGGASNQVTTAAGNAVSSNQNNLITIHRGSTTWTTNGALDLVATTFQPLDIVDLRGTFSTRRNDVGVRRCRQIDICNR